MNAEEREVHERWMQEWREKFVVDEQILDDVLGQVRLQRIRLTQRSSNQHPGEVITDEITVVGHGWERLYMPNSHEEVVRLLLVGSNGLGFHVRPGMKIEVQKGNGSFGTVADFPSQPE